MPQARRSTSSRQRAFKEPAALKRLNKSLDAATEALAELRKETGRGASQGTRDLHKELRTLVSGARRFSGRLGNTLEREFARAQKQVSERSTSTARRRSTSSGRRTSSASSRRGSSTSSRRSSSSSSRRTSASAGRGSRSTRKTS